MARKKKADETIEAATAADDAEAATVEAEADAEPSASELSADDMEALIDPTDDDDAVEEEGLQPPVAVAEAAAPAGDQPGAEATEAAAEAAPAEAPAEQPPAEGEAVGEGAEAGAEEAAAAEAVAPEAQPPAEAAPAAVPAPAAAAEPAQTEEERLAAHIAWREKTEAELASTVFAFTEEQVQEVEDSPAAALPKLAARLYLQSVEGASRAIISHLPVMMEQLDTQRNKAVEHGKAFFKEWPQLNNQEAAAVLHRIGQTYRQINPAATPAEFIRDVGAATMVARKFPEAASAAPSGTAVPAAAPVTSPAALPAHAPVGQGAPAAAGPTSPANPFSQMAEEILADDM